MSRNVRFSQDQPDVAYVTQRTTAGGLVAELFSKPLPPAYKEDKFEMDIFTAASIGELGVIKNHLVSPGFNPNSKNRITWTALLYAAYLGHEPACKLLLDYGASPDECNSRGQTALMFASACGNVSCVRLLIERGASVQRADDSDRQALHYAASCSQNVVAEVLLKSGSDANARDVTGMTPMLEACGAAHELTVLSLIEKGGDPLLVNNRGENGLSLAHECPKILQIIQQNQTSSKQPQTLIDLLEALSLGRLAPKFERENVDLQLFFELNEKDFDDMGVAYGPKKKMLTVIDRYRTSGVIVTDTFDTGVVPNSVPSDETDASALREAISTIRFVKENNENIKQMALEALENISSSPNAAILRPLLVNIIDQSEKIAARTARHH